MAGRRALDKEAFSVGTIASKAEPVITRAREVWARLAPVLDVVQRRVSPVWAVVTPIGRVVLFVGLAAWFLAHRYGWEELAIVATACLLLLAIAALFLIGSTNIAVKMSAEPPRVTVGDSVTGSIEVTNRAKTPMLPVTLELPVGAGGVNFPLPPLLPGSSHEELFVVPTERRSVIQVGPVTTARGDAIGLLRRDVTWTDSIEIFVHPKVTPLEPLSAGLVKDLEGNASNTISPSDLAFHALREYAPGDDLRHVHWRSSAKHGSLLVRQFLDTRRSHLNAIVDCQRDAYDSEDDYELAVSVAGSMLVRAIMDGYDATFLCGTHAMTRGTGRAALDACSRAELGNDSLTAVAARGANLAPDTSVVFLITGPHTDFITLQRAAANFSIEAAKVVVRVQADAQPSLRAVADLPLLTLGRLEQLPSLLKWGLSD